MNKKKKAYDDAQKAVKAAKIEYEKVKGKPKSNKKKKAYDAAKKNAK